MTFKIEENTIHTQGVSFTYSRPIYDAIAIGDTVIVLLAMSGIADGRNNLYAIRDGDRVWQVQDLAQYRGEPFSKGCHPGPYCSIRIYEKDPSLLISNTGMGIPFLIDPLNGRIVGQESWTK